LIIDQRVILNLGAIFISSLFATQQSVSMKKIVSFIFIAIGLASFSSYGQETSQMKQVMTAHDEVMAKMPHLVKLINALQPKADTTQIGQKYQDAIDGLKTSNSSMMTWMQGFGKRFTADEMLKGKALSEEKKQWLTQENKKIETLRKEINASMDKAKLLLDK
jgi:hypothetical protein